MICEQDLFIEKTNQWSYRYVLFVLALELTDSPIKHENISLLSSLNFNNYSYIFDLIMTNLSKIEIVNFALIWIILWLAYAFPFELFLFSYAVLGPLHYLTEINWLEKKNYFLKNPSDKKTYLLMVIGVLCISATAFFIPELSKWDATKSLYHSFSQSTLYKLNLPHLFGQKWSINKI